MKKSLLTLLLLLTIGIGANAQSKIVDVLTNNEMKFSAYNTLKSYTSSTTDVTYKGAGAQNTDLQFNAADKSGLFSSANTKDLELAEVTITFTTGTSNNRKVTLYASDQAYTDLTKTPAGTKIGDATKTSTETSFTFNLKDSGYKYFYILPSGSAVYLSSVNVAYVNPEAGSKVDAELALKQDGNDVAGSTLSFVEGEEHNLELLVNPNNIPANEIVYTSTNPEVAVMANGILNVKGVVGQTDITVSFAGNDNYFEQTLEFSVKVISAEEASYTVETLTINNLKVSSYGSNSTPNTTYDSEISGVGYKGAAMTNAGAFQLNDPTKSGIFSYQNTQDLDIVEIIINFTSTTDRSVTIYASEDPYTALNQKTGTEVGTATHTSTVSSVTFNLKGEGLKYFSIVPAGKAVYLSSVVVKYAHGSQSALQPAELSFTNADVTVELGDEAPANPLLNPNNLTVTWSSSNEAVATVDATGALTIAGEGTTTITAASEATDQFRAGKASYVLTVVKLLKANSIAEMNALVAEDNKAEIKVNFPVTVTYKNDNYTYVTDGTDYTLLYQLPTNYADLDIIPAGWTAKDGTYNQLPEFKCVGSMPAADGTGTFSPREVNANEVSLANVNEIVIINNVEFEEATPASKATVTASGLTFYNQFGIESVEAGTYSVKAAITRYKENMQVYPIEYNVASAVEVIETAAGEAAYYDINGRPVTGELAKGLYIKVAAGKAEKILVK